MPDWRKAYTIAAIIFAALFVSGEVLDSNILGDSHRRAFLDLYQSALVTALGVGLVWSPIKFLHSLFVFRVKTAFIFLLIFSFLALRGPFWREFYGYDLLVRSLIYPAVFDACRGTSNKHGASIKICYLSERYPIINALVYASDHQALPLSPKMRFGMQGLQGCSLYKTQQTVFFDLISIQESCG